MAVQGRRLDEGQIKRITQLLAETDMSIAEIAERMQCSRSAVASIKRKWRVRGERCETTSIQPVERLAPPGSSLLHVPSLQFQRGVLTKGHIRRRCKSICTFPSQPCCSRRRMTNFSPPLSRSIWCTATRALKGSEFAGSLIRLNKRRSSLASS